VIALDITINGTEYGGGEEITAVTVVAEYVGGRRGDRVSVHGQSSDGRLQWLDAHLSIGDEIRVRIVETSSASSSIPEACSFCVREAREVAKLVTGTKVGICDDCTKRFAASVKSGAALPIGASIQDDPQQACGFCGEDGSAVGGVIVRNGAAICGQCIRTCEELTEE